MRRLLLVCLRGGGCVGADLPFAWVNLKHGVGPEERAIEETNTAAVGSFTLELGLLSRLTSTFASPYVVTSQAVEVSCTPCSLSSLMHVCLDYKPEAVTPMHLANAYMALSLPAHPLGAT